MSLKKIFGLKSPKDPGGPKTPIEPQEFGATDTAAIAGAQESLISTGPQGLKKKGKTTGRRSLIGDRSPAQT